MRRKKITHDWLQTSHWSFNFFRFCLTSLYTILFGRFPRPKKCHFCLKRIFLKKNFLKLTVFRHSILIICHFVHISFSTLFLNVAWYMLLAISWTIVLTPINVRFFCFYFDLMFSIFFL